MSELNRLLVQLEIEKSQTHSNNARIYVLRCLIDKENENIITKNKG